MAKKTPTRPGANGRKRVSRTTNKRKTPVKNRTTLASLFESLRRRLGSQTDDVWGVALVVAAILIGLAFFGDAGPFGSWITDGLRYLFGLWAYLIPALLTTVGVILIVGNPRTDYPKIGIGTTVSYLGALSLFHLLTGAVELFGNADLIRARGGAIGSLISFPMSRVIGFWGALVVLSALTSMGILLASRTSVRELFVGFSAVGKRLKTWAGALTVDLPAKAPAQRPRHVASKAPSAHRPKLKKPTSAPEKSRPEPVKKAKKEETSAAARMADKTYQLPPIELLRESKAETHNRRALEETAADLEETLRQHGVDAKLTKIVPGPTVTRYEIELAAGVKVSRVTNLATDIAYAMATPDVRLLAPIPGKSAIGVEVPNRKRRMVTLGDILRTQEAHDETHPMVVGIGMDINSRAALVNLAELPHVLIAGATGAGKSSCMNSLITSILMRAHPDEVRMIMVDPKRVELGQYNGVPHLLTRVITNPKKANEVLKWAVDEMDRRYDLLADSGVRDIGGYHEKWDAGGIDEDGFDRFPYLVILIDELNDLMMVAGRDVENSIVRIAQMARAVGIHLVIATQRPSVNVITGVIKANIPSRMAFSVASQTDSRVIIDTIGAEKLVGMGDLLLVTAKDPKPARVQGAWVSEEEVRAVVDWVKKQKETKYEDKVIEASVEKARVEAAEEDDEDADLVRQAMDLVVRSGLGSTSMLQRKLRIGFARAGRVMDILENRGVVGPSLGSKAREVLMTADEFDEMLAGASH